MCSTTLTLVLLFLNSVTSQIVQNTSQNITLEIIQGQTNEDDADVTQVEIELLIEPLKPKGLRISTPAIPGISMFAVHAKINEDFSNGEENAIADQIHGAKKGRWTFLNKTIELKPGDKIHYWVYIAYASTDAPPFGYIKHDQVFEVKQFTPYDDEVDYESDFGFITIRIEPLSPKGLRASIPDNPEVKLFSFHAKINADFNEGEQGTIFQDAVEAKNGRWTIVDRKIALKPGDKIYYWVYLVLDTSIGQPVEHTISGFPIEVVKLVEDKSADNVKEFQIPDVLIEPIKPNGLRASIPDIPGIKLFGFNAKINKKFTHGEKGTFSQIIVKPENGRWVFNDKRANLKVGDIINYWVYVSVSRGNVPPASYYKRDLVYEVKELLDENSQIRTAGTKTQIRVKPPCTTVSQTVINNGQKTCKGELIFEDDFNALDKTKWLVEQYIPSLNGPDYEFNSYWDDPEIVFINQSVLNVRPKAYRTLQEVRQPIDFRNKCTRTSEEDCYRTTRGFLLPPVKSGKVTSKFSFKYGKIDVRAKLPSGDWIVPIVGLYSTNGESTSRIIISYARGNKILANEVGDDIGSKKLYGGFMAGDREPLRSSQLRTFTSTRHFSDEYHNYSLVWSPNDFKVYVDDLEYGDYTDLIVERNLNDQIDSEFYIAFGVAIGGINDFPDEYYPMSYIKPWINNDRNNVKSFFDRRSDWIVTWRKDRINLKIDSVKVWAL